MRALRPMTQEEREFAEQEHDRVLDFLRYRGLPIADYYDVVIFGYLSAVQQYFRNPPSRVSFGAIAVRAMKDSILRDGEYRSRAKRTGVTVGLDDFKNTITDPRQDTERQVEGKALLEQAVSVATPKEAKIINLLLDGFVLREAARRLKMPRAAAVSCMADFCCRAKAVVK